MKSRAVLIAAITLLAIVGTVSAGTTITTEYTSNNYWTCPDGVFNITLDLIGGGGGASGGYGVLAHALEGQGVGGQAATALRATDIPVTPGTEYPIIIGQPGTGQLGWNSNTAAVYNGSSGTNSTAFGYTAIGAYGWLNNLTYDGLGNLTRNGDAAGESSTLGLFKVAEDGGYGYSSGDEGASAGYGYGAGGGAGGNGYAYYPGFSGGAGGDGAAGYARITYVSNTSSTDTYKVKYPPSDVRFHVQEISGKSLTEVFVTAAPFQSTLGNYGSVASLFGYDLVTIPLDLMQLNGTTDTRGDITFAMMSDVSYKMTFAKTGYTFDEVTITPHDDNYIIYPTTTGSFFVTNGTAPVANVAYNVTSRRINSTYGEIVVTYFDSGGATTWGNITITSPELRT